MVVVMSILIFIITFVILLGSYILLVATSKVKKRRMDKVFKLIAAYSLAAALVYFYQFLYL